MRPSRPPWANDRRMLLLWLPVVVGQAIYLGFGLQNTVYGVLLGVYGWTLFSLFSLLAIRDWRRRGRRPRGAWMREQARKRRERAISEQAQWDARSHVHLDAQGRRIDPPLAG